MAAAAGRCASATDYIEARKHMVIWDPIARLSATKSFPGYFVQLLSILFQKPESV